MQSNNKATIDNFSLVIIENDTLLKSIKDYFYQNLFHDFDDDKIFNCSINNINQTLQQIQTEYAIVIQEGIFFFDHLDNNFLKTVINNLKDYVLIGHVLDRKDRYYQLHPQQFIINVSKWKQIGCPDFNCRKHDNLLTIQRSAENFHDDYTPLWIQADNNSISCNKLKFGGLVISEFLKNDFKVRPFNTDERHVKKFVYYELQEQIAHLLSYERLHPNSFYYAKTTRNSERLFNQTASHYVSVANAVESLYKIKDIYQDIKSIDFYDISITALIFTEHFINSFKNDYKKFVNDFDNMGARPWTTLDLANEDYYQLDNYADVDTIKPVLDHIRNNDVKINYCYGDITRTSIVEKINTSTVMYISNAFNYEHNFIRTEEKSFWIQKVKSNNNIKKILF
jgi:hypothetical protein